LLAAAQAKVHFFPIEGKGLTMQDEHFLRSWNDGHNRFSADLDRGLGHVIGRRGHRKIIGNPYGIPSETRPPLSPAARASLRGLGASVLTVVLWVVVLALATPAPGLAASPSASIACDCVVRLPLA
jgi:hypothetical protein